MAKNRDLTTIILGTDETRNALRSAFIHAKRKSGLTSENLLEKYIASGSHDPEEPEPNLRDLSRRLKQFEVHGTELSIEEYSMLIASCGFIIRVQPTLTPLTAQDQYARMTSGPFGHTAAEIFDCLATPETPTERAEERGLKIIQGGKPTEPTFKP